MNNIITYIRAGLSEQSQTRLIETVQRSNNHKKCYGTFLKESMAHGSMMKGSTLAASQPSVPVTLLEYILSDLCNLFKNASILHHQIRH